MGEDFGRPRREFFRLALKDLMNSALFEGQEHDKVFSHDVTGLEDGKYRLAGRLLGLSISQDGPGLHCLNRALYDLMTGLQSDISISNIPIDIQDMIAETLAKISEFTTGLNEVGNLWDEVKSNPELFKPVFCYYQASLEKATFDRICLVEFSLEGSNNRKMEEETVYCWEVVLQDIQDEKVPFTLEELLIFMTGADRIPICGFDKQIQISFYTQDTGIKRLPSVSTCGLQMWLP